MRTAATVKSLCGIKDVTPETARKVRAVWKAKNRAAIAALGFAADGVYPREQWRRQLIDGLIEASGVEYLGYHKRAGQHVDYCNAGDTYSTTVLFIGDRLTVGCIGDLIESGKIKEGGI